MNTCKSYVISPLFLSGTGNRPFLWHGFKGILFYVVGKTITKYWVTRRLATVILLISTISELLLKFLIAENAGTVPLGSHRTFSSGSNTVLVTRGQHSCSLGRWASRWKWAVTEVVNVYDTLNKYTYINVYVTVFDIVFPATAHSIPPPKVVLLQQI